SPRRYRDTTGLRILVTPCGCGSIPQSQTQLFDKLMTFKPTSLLRSAETIRHFTSARAVEVLALQASPLLGAVIGGVDRGGVDVARLVLLLTGSVALTAHVFVLNDWSGRSSDLND